MSKDFTDEQKLAIETRGKDVLVSAAAGSGKTSVLAERVIRMVTDKERPVSIDRLLVVTFTEAAAMEMKGRIRKSLSARIKESGDPFLKRQGLLLERASITTIHAFCLSVIREYFQMIDLDPNFKVADETEAELIKIEVMNGLLDDMYEDPELVSRVLDIDLDFEEPGRAFLDLAEGFGNRATDEALGERVMELHDFSRGESWPEEWLLKASRDGSREESGWYEFLLEETKDSITDALEAARHNLSIAKEPFIHEKYIAVLEDDVIALEYCLSAIDRAGEDPYNGLNFQFGRLSPAKVKGLSSEDEERAASLKEKIKTVRENDVKLPINVLGDKIFTKPFDERMADRELESRAVKGLCGMAIELGKRFQAAKREKNLLDFSDLEHYCIQILINREDGENKLTQAAFDTAYKFDEIFIDEYQDSNAVQELILSSISSAILGKPRNTFMVGDVKQSIYSFRLANPDIFNEKYETYDRGGPEWGLIRLSKNFRSRKAVLNTVNHICYKILSKKLGGVDYTNDEALHFGADYYNEDGPEHQTEIILIEQKADLSDESDIDIADNEEAEMSKAELEAGAAAERILGLVNGPDPFMVTGEGGQMRPARFSDIAVILRSPKSIADVYLKTFRESGISAVADVASGYFDVTEIRTALSFLRIIDNPRQDVPLAAALFSPAYGFTPSELLALRRTGTGDFYGCLTAFIELGGDIKLCNRLKGFLEDLSRWRILARTCPVSELLWTVLDETGLYLIEGAARNGTVRQANLRTLQEYAARYEKSSMKGLFHFLGYIDRIIKSKKDSGVKEAADAAADAVTIMSVHKSKGLEFPIVLLCGLGRKFNLRDSQASLIFHNKFGVGTFAVDLEKRVRSDTLKRIAISQKLRQESVSEELRVLYVAMTRAKEKLILIGEAKKYDKAAEKALAYGKARLPYRLLKKNGSFLEFIAQVLADGEGGIEIKRVSPNGVKTNTLTDMPYERLSDIDGDRNHSGYRDEIAERMYFNYPFMDDVKIPGKLSVTEIKRLFPDEYETDNLFNGEGEDILPEPAFYKTGPKLSPAIKGTVLHSVIERIDLVRHSTRDDINSLVKELADNKILGQDEAALVNTDDVLRFLSSPLANRIKRSERFWREMRFVVNVPANEVNSDWSGGSLMVHGIIDCVFIENGNAVIADYKTGRFTSPEDAVERYGKQMNYYAQAVQAHFGFPVAQKILYYFENGVQVEVK